MRNFIYNIWYSKLWKCLWFLLLISYITCRYSERANISRARTKFFQSKSHFLLFTERFYFFYRWANSTWFSFLSKKPASLQEPHPLLAGQVDDQHKHAEAFFKPSSFITVEYSPHATPTPPHYVIICILMWIMKLYNHWYSFLFSNSTSCFLGIEYVEYETSYSTNCHCILSFIQKSLTLWTRILKSQQTHFAQFFTVNLTEIDLKISLALNSVSKF